jgi:hypothetical protein
MTYGEWSRRHNMKKDDDERYIATDARSSSFEQIMTYGELRQRVAASQAQSSQDKDQNYSYYDIVRNYDERPDEHSRPRGRPPLTPWQTEDAQVSPHIGRCSGAEKVVPRKAAGPPAPSPCHHPITPMAWSCQRTDSDSSWTKLDEGSVSRKSPPRDAEGTQLGGSMLKKHKAAHRRQAQNNNKRQAASKSQDVGRTWRGKRDMEDDISPDIAEREEKRMKALNQYGEGEWKDKAAQWSTKEWQDWDDSWDDNKYQMEKHALAKTDTHVIIKKDCSEETAAPYYQNHALVPLDEARQAYDPSDAPNEDALNREVLAKAGATAIEDQRNPFLTVQDTGSIPLEHMAGGCIAASWGRGLHQCDLCQRVILLVSDFAAFKQSKNKGICKFEIIQDDDALMSKAKGEPAKNLATAEGWIGADTWVVTVRHMCVDCAEKLAFYPQGFEKGTIAADDPKFRDYPRIYHEEGTNRLTKKWKRAAANSFAPAPKSQRSRNITNILEKIVRDADKRGEKPINFEALMNQFTKDENARIAKAADWVVQITPETGGEHGACLMYTHNCDMTLAQKLQPHVDQAVWAKITSRKLLIAPLKHGLWWLTVGYSYLNELIKRAALEWDFSISSTVPQWLCPICAETHVPSVDLPNRLLAIFGYSDGCPTCVLARLGDWELNQNVTYKEYTKINVEAFISVLKIATLLKELDGHAIEKNTILEAVGALHEKAMLFFRSHFKDQIVLFKACNFREGARDRSGRVALCEDRRLSLQHVGQDVPALALDMEQCQPMERGEMIDVLITIAAFYDTSVADPTKPQQQIMYMLEKEREQSRQRVVANLTAKEHAAKLGV